MLWHQELSLERPLLVIIFIGLYIESADSQFMYTCILTHLIFASHFRPTLTFIIIVLIFCHSPSLNFLYEGHCGLLICLGITIQLWNISTCITKKFLSPSSCSNTCHPQPPTRVLHPLVSRTRPLPLYAHARVAPVLSYWSMEFCRVAPVLPYECMVLLTLHVRPYSLLSISHTLPLSPRFTLTLATLYLYLCSYSFSLSLSLSDLLSPY